MADIIPQRIIEKCRLDENIVQFNTSPQSGLGDTLIRIESMVQFNTSPQSGLGDTLIRTESMTYTN